MMKTAWIFLCITLLLTACDPDDRFTGSETVPIPPDYGYVEVEFSLPSYNKVPQEGIHRVSLGFSYTVDSLYRGEFFRKVNVSDHQNVYKIILPEGEYYYEAVITCSCDGDTCLNGGFPGGKFGMKHDFLNFYILDQETTLIKTNFE